MNQLTDLQLDLIALTPHNPRKIKKNDPAIAELARSIEASGLLQPVVCRPVGDRFELLAGARRYHAHQQLGRETILAIVRELDDRQAIEVTVLENLQREELSPIEEGRGVATLLASGHDVRAIAEEIGKTPGWVYRRAKLADLDPAVLKVVEDDDSPWAKASAAHLEVLARLPAERQRAIASGSSWMASRPVRDMIEHIERDEHKLSAAPWRLDDMTLIGFACDGCQHRTDCQPELFADTESDQTPEVLAKNARCLDPKCWAKKEGAWLNRRVVELRAEHGDKLAIVGDYDYQGKNAPVEATHATWDVTQVKKTVAGARPALMLGRGRKPQVTWVKIKTNAEARAAKPKMPPLKLRRRVHVVKAVLKALENASCPFTTDRALLAFITTFGTRESERFCHKATWSKAETLAKGDIQDLHKAAWEQVRPILKSRLNFYQVGGIEPHYADALQMIDLLSLDREALDGAAMAALPDKQKPKAATTSKSRKSKNQD